MGSRLANLRNLGLSGRVTVITAVMLLLYVASAPLAWWHSGGIGLLAAGTSATVCLIGRVGGLVASDHCRGPSRALHGLACSMAARTGLPLLLAIAMRFQDGALFKAGGVYYLLVFYLAALAVETPLSLRPGQKRTCPDQADAGIGPARPQGADPPRGIPTARFRELVLTDGRFG